MQCDIHLLIFDFHYHDVRPADHLGEKMQKTMKK